MAKAQRTALFSLSIILSVTWFSACCPGIICPPRLCDRENRSDGSADGSADDAGHSGDSDLIVRTDADADPDSVHYDADSTEVVPDADSSDADGRSDIDGDADSVCADDSHCPINQFCLESVCVPWRSYPACYIDQQCRLGEFCDDGLCAVGR